MKIALVCLFILPLLQVNGFVPSSRTSASASAPAPAAERGTSNDELKNLLNEVLDRLKQIEIVKMEFSKLISWHCDPKSSEDDYSGSWDNWNYGHNYQDSEHWSDDDYPRSWDNWNYGNNYQDPDGWSNRDNSGRWNNWNYGNNYQDPDGWSNGDNSGRWNNWNYGNNYQDSYDWSDEDYNGAWDSWKYWKGRNVPAQHRRHY